MILRPSDIPGGKHAGDKNIESNHQRSDIMLKHVSGDWHHYLYHDVWVDERYRHSIYLPYTLTQPFIFPYTLGCMVARTTNALAVANRTPNCLGNIGQLNHGTSQRYHGFLGCMVCTLCVVICIPSGFALENTHNYTQGTNPIHPRNPWYNYYLYHIAEIETQAYCFQWMHVNHTHFSAMQADTSKKVTWL